MKTVLLPEAPGYRAGGLWGEQGGGREGGGGGALPSHHRNWSGPVKWAGSSPCAEGGTQGALLQGEVGAKVEGQVERGRAGGV